MPEGDNRGLVSLDTLIIFIAVLLVVMVTAIVLITSSTSLQQRIMMKSVEGRKDVSSGVEVIDVIGTDASSSGGSPHNIEDVYLQVRLLPASILINLNDTLILFDDGVDHYILEYNTTCESECPASTTNTFNAHYMKSGQYWQSGYINRGDIAKLSIKPPEAMREDREYVITIYPANGPSTSIRIQTPETMLSSRQTLWPIA